MKWLVFIGLLLANVVEAKPQKKYVKKAFERAAKKVGISPALLRAVCWGESHHDTQAFVKSDGGEKNHAIGICQVTYNTATDYGFKDERCRQDFTNRKSERSYANCGLFGPYTNAYYAALYLKSRLDKYDNDWIHAISAYNTGSLKYCKTGKVYSAHTRKFLYECKEGELLNWTHVKRVIEALKSSR